MPQEESSALVQPDEWRRSTVSSNQSRASAQSLPMYSCVHPKVLKGKVVADACHVLLDKALFRGVFSVMDRNVVAILEVCFIHVVDTYREGFSLGIQ